jgi:hypothetical protein
MICEKGWRLFWKSANRYSKASEGLPPERQ